MTGGLVLHGGPGHDFAATAEILGEVLAGEGVDADLEDDVHRAIARLGSGRYSLLVVNALRWRMEQPRYADERDSMAVSLGPDERAGLDRFVRAGGGLLAVHTAVICFDGEPWWRDLCGATWEWGTSTHPPFGPCEVHVTDSGRRHPITAGLDDFTVDDEVYGSLDRMPGLDPLLDAGRGGRRHPLLWARPVGRGRVVTDVLGHAAASLRHPVHRTILARAAAWAHPRERTE